MAKQSAGASRQDAVAAYADVGTTDRAVSGGDEARFVVFRIAAGQFGFLLDEVREILRPPTLAYMPLAPRSLLGLANLRGVVLKSYGAGNIPTDPEFLGLFKSFVDKNGIVAGGYRIPSATVLWTAGVQASPIPRMLGTPIDRAGRALVDPQLQVAPDVFVVGDAASFTQDGHPVPGLAQAAIQEGRYVGRLIANALAGRPTKPFRYFDLGNMAVVGKNYAVLQRGLLLTSGFLTWLLWAFIHILSLPQLQNRLRVQRQWFWSYLTGQRSSRLITEESRGA